MLETNLWIVSVHYSDSSRRKSEHAECEKEWLRLGFCNHTDGKMASDSTFVRCMLDWAVKTLIKNMKWQEWVFDSHMPMLHPCIRKVVICHQRRIGKHKKIIHVADLLGFKFSVACQTHRFVTNIFESLRRPRAWKRSFEGNDGQRRYARFSLIYCNLCSFIVNCPLLN